MRARRLLLLVWRLCSARFKITCYITLSVHSSTSNSQPAAPLFHFAFCCCFFSLPHSHTQTQITTVRRARYNRVPFICMLHGANGASNQLAQRTRKSGRSLTLCRTKTVYCLIKILQAESSTFFHGKYSTVR